MNENLDVSARVETPRFNPSPFAQVMLAYLCLLVTIALIVAVALNHG